MKRGQEHFPCFSDIAWSSGFWPPEIHHQIFGTPQRNSRCSKKSYNQPTPGLCRVWLWLKFNSGHLLGNVSSPWTLAQRPELSSSGFEVHTAQTQLSASCLLSPFGFCSSWGPLPSTFPPSHSSKKAWFIRQSLESAHTVKIQVLWSPISNEGSLLPPAPAKTAPASTCSLSAPKGHLHLQATGLFILFQNHSMT